MRSDPIAGDAVAQRDPASDCSGRLHASVASFTAQNGLDPYLGLMQPLRKEDLFTGIDARTLEDPPWTPPSETSFDTFRGLLLAGALGVPFWAAVFLICWWIWL